MISAVILAAGLSRRMERPKQLLRLGDKTMIEHVVEHVMKTDVREIVVVLGAYWQEIQDILMNYNVKSIFNPHYNDGQGSSVAAGVRAVSRSASGIMYLTADQPFLSPVFLNRMIAEFRKSDPLILKPEVGMPAVFNSSLRTELMTLSGDTGGRLLIKKYQDKVMSLRGYPSTMIMDVDTEEDYQRAKELWDKWSNVFVTAPN